MSNHSPVDRSSVRTGATSVDDDPVARLSAAQVRALNLFEPDEGPVSIHVLAERSGQHPNTLREHLQALVERGLVRTDTGVPSGRGRPPLLYEAVPLERVRPHARAYGLLATALAEHIARTSPNAAEEAIDSGRRAGVQLARSGEVTLPENASSMDALVELLTHLGFAPVQHGNRVALGICPFLQVATSVPTVVCNAHLGIVQGFFDANGDTSRLRLNALPKGGMCEVVVVDADS